MNPRPVNALNMSDDDYFYSDAFRDAADAADAKNLFLVTFFVVGGNSLLIDVVLFARVLLYVLYRQTNKQHVR